jgi:hypothetical protein
VSKDYNAKHFTDLFENSMWDQKQHRSLEDKHFKLFDEHRDTTMRGRGYRNGYKWIQQQHVFLRHQIDYARELANIENPVESRIHVCKHISEQPQVPECSSARMTPSDRAEIFAATFEGDMCGCEVCLRNKVTLPPGLPDVLRHNKTLRDEMKRLDPESRTVQFAGTSTKEPNSRCSKMDGRSGATFLFVVAVYFLTLFVDCVV